MNTKLTPGELLMLRQAHLDLGSKTFALYGGGLVRLVDEHADLRARIEALEAALLPARDGLALALPVLRRAGAKAAHDEAHAGLKAVEEVIGVYEGPEYVTEAARLRAWAERAKAVLERVEFVWFEEGRLCPLCEQREHAPDCELAALLEPGAAKGDG